MAETMTNNMKPKYILSPCGTSILTNQARNGDERKLVFKHANKKNADEIPAADREQLAALIARVSGLVEQADYREASRMSAELNGIIRIYDGLIPPVHDFHFLLSTDTWLGAETARLVKKWLSTTAAGLVIDVYRQTDLQTRDLEAFQVALSDLLRKLSEELPVYSQKGYRVIFNLTGGFKSIQGFLQSIANFYADETVYIFETATELMRIPRLPVRMNAMETIRDRITTFRRLHLDLPVSPAALREIPETLLFKIEGETILSPWGKLVFFGHKDDIYSEDLLPSPLPDRLSYSERFQKESKALPADRIRIVNERIDQLCRHLNDESYNPSSLDFKRLKGKPKNLSTFFRQSIKAAQFNKRLKGKPKNLSTHEIDAWADLDAKRIFGHFEHDVFILDAIDKGLH